MSKLKMAACVCTGLLAGLVIAYGAVALEGRNGGAPGGEVLILPLMAGLVYLGYMVRQWMEEARQ